MCKYGLLYLVASAIVVLRVQLRFVDCINKRKKEEGQAHTQTDRHTTTAYTAISIASRGKNTYSNYDIMSPHYHEATILVCKILMKSNMHNFIAYFSTTHFIKCDWQLYRPSCD